MQVSEVILRFLEGENEGVEIRVNPPRELTIGRSEECDIFLGEKKISRKHCRIVVEKDGVKLVDLQSTNGTFHNSKKVSGEVPLTNNDKVRVGTSVIQLTIEEEKAVIVEEPPTRSVAEREAPSIDFDSSDESLDFPSPNDASSGPMSTPKEDSFSLGFGDVEENARVSHAPRNEADAEVRAKPLAGNLSAMGLADLLQNLAQNKKSGLLVLNAATEGRIAIIDGKIASALAGNASGPKALYRMLSWNDGDFEFLPLPSDFDPRRVETPMNEQMESLLMEGFRQFDELEKIRKALPSMNAKLSVKRPLTAPLSKLHPRVLDVLQVIMNEGKFQDVLDQSTLSDLETSKIIFYLLKKEYISAS